MVIQGATDEMPPPVVNPNTGKCRYPFDQLDVGHALWVTGRLISTIRSAVRRWVAQDKARRGRKFLVWKAKTPDGKACVRVKRVK